MAVEGVIEGDPFLQGSQTMELEAFESLASKGLGSIEEPKKEEEPQAEQAEELSEEAAALIDTGEEAPEPVEVSEEDDAREKADIAENKRLRSKNREVEAEKQAMAERIAKLEGRMEERSKGEETVHDQIARASDEELTSAKKTLELQMFDAMEAKDKALYQRALDGKAIIEAQQQSRLKPVEANTVDEAKAQFLEVHDSLQDLYPEALDKTSPFGKEVVQFADKNKALMKNLGPLGELMAVASVIAMKPELLRGKKTAIAAERLETGIKTVVQNAVSKGKTRTSTAARGTSVPKTVDGVNSLIEKISSGAVSLDQLTN